MEPGVCIVSRMSLLLGPLIESREMHVSVTKSIHLFSDAEIYYLRLVFNKNKNFILAAIDSIRIYLS